MRKTKEELEQIKKDNHVDTLYSWSRVSSWWNGKYNWYLNYVKHEPPDRCDCIYGTSGNFAHDIVEKLYLKEIQYKDMLPEFENAWEFGRNVLGLKFDRNDVDKDDKLADKYQENLIHFFQNHQQIPYELHTEDFATIKVGNHILIGYIDAWYLDDKKNLHIVDWKTSSIYTGAKLIEKSGQLMMYATSFIQRGVPIDKIKLDFNFLKYATITYEQANGKMKSMNVERRLLGEKLQSSCRMWLKKFGYEPDEYLKQVLDSGDINCLPLEVQDKIEITDCYVSVPVTQELLQFWTDKVNDTINEIEGIVEMYEMIDDDSLFYDTIEEIEKESYFYATLSEYSANKNICYQKYLEYLEEKQQNNIKLF